MRVLTPDYSALFLVSRAGRFERIDERSNMHKDGLDIAEFVLKILGGGGALVAFYVGLARYKEAQNWRKAQVILNLIDSFKSDKFIQAACLMLDWDQRNIDFGDGRTIQFKNDLLERALEVIRSGKDDRIPIDKVNFADVESQTGCGFTPDECAIRDSFDKFFDFFDKVYAFRRKELLQISDISYFYYWFELVRTIGKYKEDDTIQTVMNEYISAYKFRGFEALSLEYSHNAEELFVPL